MEREDPWDENDGEELEGEILRADHPFAADLRGTTPEEAEGELSIDDALARERPEKRTTDEVIALEDEGASDEEGELVADDSVERDDFPSPRSRLCPSEEPRRARRTTRIHTPSTKTEPAVGAAY